MQKERDIDSLEVRNYSSLKWKTMIVLLLCTATVVSIIIQISSKDFWYHFKSSSVFYFIGLAIMAWGIIYYSNSLYYDRWIQLKIDKEGIWTPKYKTWYWEDIWYFSTRNEIVGNARNHILEVKLKDGVNDDRNLLLLPLDDYDKSIEEIRWIIEKYAALNGVQDLGNNIIN